MCQKTLNWVNHVYLPSQNKEHCIVLKEAEGVDALTKVQRQELKAKE